MFKKSILIIVVFTILALVAACGGEAPTPATIVETVIVKETVQVEVEKEVVVTQEVEKVVTQEVEKIVTQEVEKVVTVEVEKIVTQEVEKEVEKVVTVMVTPTPTPSPTVDSTHPKVREVMEQVTLVQHHFNPDTDVTTFTCVSEGLGLEGVEPNPEGPIYVGPNSKDFDLWGAVGLFEIQPDGTIYFVPERTGDVFIDPEENKEYERIPLNEVLNYFASGEARWTGEHGEPGRIGECDPQYATPEPDE